MENFEVPMSPEIKEFLVRMLKDSDSFPDSEELQEMMLSDLYTRLQAKFVIVLSDYLDEHQLETYSKLSIMDPAQGNAYLEEQLPQYKAIFIKALAEFREVFLGK